MAPRATVPPATARPVAATVVRVRERSDRGERSGDRPPRRSGGPRFTAPPELPQRPKAKRLKPGRTHRNAVLAELPEEQRPIAERALQGGIPAVRQAVNEQNARLKSEGKPEVPAAGLLSLAEQLLPKLRVAEWLDRADAALRDLDELDLRDLRSVVAAAEDPTVARDETTRDIAAQLKEGLQTKQDKEMALWLGDIEAAIGIGRIVRALKLSSQPPKAGSRFPAELAGQSGRRRHRGAQPRRPAGPLGRGARSGGVLPDPQPRPADRQADAGQRRTARHRQAPRRAAAPRRRAVRDRGRPQGPRAQAAAPDASRRRQEEAGPADPAPAGGTARAAGR